MPVREGRGQASPRDPSGPESGTVRAIPDTGTGPDADTGRIEKDTDGHRSGYGGGPAVNGS